MCIRDRPLFVKALRSYQPLFALIKFGESPKARTTWQPGKPADLKAQRVSPGWARSVTYAQRTDCIAECDA